MTTGGGDGRRRRRRRSGAGVVAVTMIAWLVMRQIWRDNAMDPPRPAPPLLRPTSRTSNNKNNHSYHKNNNNKNKNNKSNNKNASRVIVMCATVQDDEAYLDEWVDYHFALGVTHFALYDTSERGELQQWGEEKGHHVTVIPWGTTNHRTTATITTTSAADGAGSADAAGAGNGGNGWTAAQITAYADCLQQCRTDHNNNNHHHHDNHHTDKHDTSLWVALWNVADFFVGKQQPQPQPTPLPNDDHTIPHVLWNHSTGNEPTVMGLYQRVFGSAGRRIYAPQPVTKRFVAREPLSHRPGEIITNYLIPANQITTFLHNKLSPLVLSSSSSSSSSLLLYCGCV